MTDEQIKQNAEEYALKKTLVSTDSFHGMVENYLAGAHSLDEEIKELEECIKVLDMNLVEQQLENLQLLNPWIIIEDIHRIEDYPKIRNNQDDIWERSDDVLVMTKEGKLEIAYFEIHRNNNPISSHGDYLLWYKRDKEYNSKVELYGNREVIKWMPIK